MSIKHDPFDKHVAVFRDPRPDPFNKPIDIRAVAQHDPFDIVLTMRADGRRDPFDKPIKPLAQIYNERLLYEGVSADL